MLSVNSLVDRLSPISDPDVEANKAAAAAAAAAAVAAVASHLNRNCSAENLNGKLNGVVSASRKPFYNYMRMFFFMISKVEKK